MLRALLIYLSQAEWAQNLVHNWGFARKMALRFVAGEELESAISVVDDLNDKGINVTLDHLGEHVSNPEDAEAATDEILLILDRIEKEKLRSGVSIKLTQLGLGLEEDFCAQNLTRILNRAKDTGLFVRIDMEESKFTDDTLDLYFMMLDKGFESEVGIVLQSYLYRSESDLEKVLEYGGKVRLCKGAYKEPPHLAFSKKEEVDQNFDRMTKMLLDFSLESRSRLSEDGVFPPAPAIATHDEDRIQYAKAYAKEIGLPREGLEFQMLHGIREDLQVALVEEGYPVRTYVPYGTEWYPYFVRRLAERPANLWFFLSNLIRG